jgi:hypothetical protein
MLSSLSIRDIVLIEKLDLSLADGLTVLTVLPEMDGTVTVTGRDRSGRVWRIRTADREVTA